MYSANRFTQRPACRLISVLLALGLTLGLFAGCQKKTVDAGALDVSAFSVSAGEKDGLIAADAAFTIQYGGKESLSADALKGLLQLEPQQEFTLKKEGQGFTLTPAQPFGENTVVNLRLLDKRGVVLRSWAFQTSAGFAVLETTPRDGTDYVPTVSGIEFVFSRATVSEEDFLSHFTLKKEEDGTPVEGTVKKAADRIAFVPKEGLQPLTIYTATLDAQLPAGDGELLGKETSFSFKTSEIEGEGYRSGGYFENASPISENFLPGEAPLIAVNCDDSFQQASPEASVSVYRFKGAQDYKSALQALMDARNETSFPSSVRPEVDTAALDNLGTFQVALTTPQSTGNRSYWGPSYLILPGEYDYGWYYFDVKIKSPKNGEEFSLQKFIQVSDLSVYSVQADGDNLFWLNDSQSGEALGNVKITLSGGEIDATGSSAADGTALIAAGTKEDSRQSTALLEIEHGERPYLDLFSLQQDSPPTGKEQYVSYLYTDRPIYMSSDTIRLWGLVRPRGNTPAPQNLRVTLGGYDEELYEVPITLAPDGTFLAELSYEKLAGKQISYERVQLMCGEEDVLSTVGVEVGDYQKPAYYPSISSDKVIYRAGENAVMTFNASFFDGTPAHNFSATLSCGNLSDQDYTFVTDEAGSAVQTIKLPQDRDPEAYQPYDWRPDQLYYYVENASGENENFSLSGELNVLYRDMALRGELSGEGEQQALTILTNRIDTSKIQEQDDVYDDENLLGAPVDADVTAEVHRVFYTKTEAGSYYDFVKKENVTYYEYERQDEVVSTERYRTAGGRYELRDLPVSSGEDSYYVLLSAEDSAGKRIEEKVWIGSDSYRYQQGRRRLSFQKSGAGEDYQRSYHFKDGEDVVFDVMDSGELLEGGKLLQAVAQTGVSSYAVQDGAKARLAFDESLVPNYYIAGAWFDGKHVYNIENQQMSFDPGARELGVSVQTDKERYAPGESAKITVSAAYPDGKPAAGAAVSLSLVDEAVFAIMPQEADPLSGLYEDAYQPDMGSYASYREYNFLGDMAAEKGGGGGDGGIRTDFQDTAAFLGGTTDEQGNCSFEVALPDNITSWRATAQAVTTDLRAGAARPGVIVTGDFFLNEVMSKTLLEGDDATLSLRAYGDAVKSSDTVDYTVSVEGNGQKLEQKATGKAGEQTVLPIGKLQKGEYTVTMQAKFGEYQDAVQKPLQVIGSGVEATLTSKFSLADGVQIEPTRFPVVLGFYDEDYAFYDEVLGSLARAGGSRADERLARQYANDKLRALSGEEELFPGMQDDLSDVIDGSYVRLYPYDSDSIPLAAKVHLAAPEYLVGGDMTAGFYNAIGSRQMGDSEADLNTAAAAYLGLAAHRAPVLGQLRALLEQREGYTLEQQLWLLAALAAIGDGDAAKGYYDEIVAPNLKEGETGAGIATLTLGESAGDVEENLRLTALASISASILRLPDAQGMVRYLMSNRSTLDNYLLEQVVYLRYNEPQGTSAAAFSYQKDGKREKVELDKTGMTFLNLTADQFGKADLKLESGNVLVSAYYLGSAAEASEQENNQITLKKTIETTDGGPMKPGSIVRITLTPVLPNNKIDPSKLTVDDYIPSGMRYLGMGSAAGEYDEKYNHYWNLISREEQRVSFCYFDWEDGLNYYGEMEGGFPEEPVPGEQTYPEIKPLTYYARCATPGAYVVDGAYASSPSAMMWGMSERTNVQIDE